MFCPSFPHKTTDWLGRPRQETKLWWARLEGVGESLVRESPPPPSYPAVWWRVMTSLWNDSNKSNESKMEILSLVALLIFFLVLLFITWHFISCFCLRGRVGVGVGVKCLKLLTHDVFVCLFAPDNPSKMSQLKKCTMTDIDEWPCLWLSASVASLKIRN